MNQDEQIMEIKELNQKIAQEPKNADLYLDLAQIYFDQEDFEKCIELKSKAIEVDPNNFKCHFYRGNTYQHIKNYERAISDFEQGVLINSNEPDIYYNLGYCYLIVGNYINSSNAMSNFIQLKNLKIQIPLITNNQSDTELYRFGKFLYEIIKIAEKPQPLHNWEESFIPVVKICNRILELNPLFYKSYILIGDCLDWDAENYIKSIEIRPTFEAYFKLSQNYDDWNSSGCDYIKAKKYRILAFELLEKGDICNVELSGFYLSLGQDYFNQKEYEKAINYFMKSHDSDAVLYIGQSHRLLGDYEKALVFYKKWTHPDTHSEYYNQMRCLISLYAAFCYLKMNKNIEADKAISYFKAHYSADIHSIFQEGYYLYNGTVIDFDEAYNLLYQNKFITEFVNITNFIMTYNVKHERYSSQNLILAYKKDPSFYGDNFAQYQDPANAETLLFFNIFVLLTENKMKELENYISLISANAALDDNLLIFCDNLSFSVDQDSIIVAYLIKNINIISSDLKVKIVLRYLTEFFKSLEDAEVRNNQKELVKFLIDTIDADPDKTLLSRWLKVLNGEKINTFSGIRAYSSVNIPSILPKKSKHDSNIQVLLKSDYLKCKYSDDLKNLILAYDNYIRLKENLRHEHEKQQARLEERNLIIQKQAHDIKNMLSSVSAPISIVQNKINSPLLKQALKANQLMSRAIDAISQSFGVNPDDFYYDAKNNENGVTLNDLIWSALDNSISNIMANNNRMKQFTNNYFASANWKQANSDYANLEEHDKHEIISEFKTFIFKYFFQLEIDFDNSADIKIGTTKSSDFNLLSLFNELILNAVKYASYTEFEKRKVVISLANNGNEIVFSVSNSSMKTIDTKTAGTGNLILENFTKLISCKFETNYSEANAMYSSKLILNNFWESKDV